MIYSRFSKLPSRFVEDYEAILVIMTIVGSEMRRGLRLDCNCYSVTRALTQFFPDFKRVNGYVPKLSLQEAGPFHGSPALLQVEGEAHQDVRFKRLLHSWMVWRDSNLILDPWPVGAQRGCNPPIVVMQDGFDISYVETPTLEVPNESLVRERATELAARVNAILSEVYPQGWSIKEAA